MFTLNGNDITLTRGDSFIAMISIIEDGQPYTPQEGDVIRFAMKKTYYDDAPAVEKTINGLTLVLNPEDTADLMVWAYVYDIELTKADGTVQTFISGKLTLLPEVV